MYRVVRLLLCACLAASCSRVRPVPAASAPAAPSSNIAQEPLPAVPAVVEALSVPPSVLELPRAAVEPVVLAPQPLALPGLRPLIERAVRKHELPGAVVAVGSSRGLAYLEAFGERTTAEPMTPDTLFDVASVTKAVVTSTAIWQLIEQGRLSLDTRVSSVLPAFARWDKAQITLRQLLVHTSGLRSVLRLSAFEAGAQSALEAVASSTLESAPGSTFRYSDLGYFVLGQLVEAISGEPLELYAQRHIFVPLAMRDSGFRPPEQLRSRVAPTEERDGQIIRGEVDDPRAYRLGGVAGHAGLFSTAADLGRFAQALLRAGELDGQRLLSATTVKALTTAEAAGAAQRTPGWDAQSSYSIGRGLLLSQRAFGHGGYTGTSLWIDPERDLFVVLLTNRVHSGALGTIHPLASAVIDVAAHGLAAQREPAAALSLGIDQLEQEAFARLRGARVGVLSHFAARDGQGRSTLDVLKAAPRVHVAAVFAPEHGLASDREGALGDARLTDDVPVYSLFGKERVPTASKLAGLDAVVIDLVDVGTRFYTYMSTASAMLGACHQLGIDVLVLDRPNPIGGDVVEGPVSEQAFASFVNYTTLPLRHGLTAGELLRLIAHERGFTPPDVVLLRGYDRHMLFDETGLTWHAPSPNLPSPEQTLLYPAVALLEGTRVSVGRGTNLAFRVIGAPFIDAEALSASLRELLPSSVAAHPTSFVPRVGPHAGRRVPGVEFEVRDAHGFRAAAVGLALARGLLTLYRAELDEARLDPLIAHQATLTALRSGRSLSELPALWEPELSAFEKVRALALLYSPTEAEAAPLEVARLGPAGARSNP